MQSLACAADSILVLSTPIALCKSSSDQPSRRLSWCSRCRCLGLLDRGSVLNDAMCYTTRFMPDDSATTSATRSASS